MWMAKNVETKRQKQRTKKQAFCKNNMGFWKSFERLFLKFMQIKSPGRNRDSIKVRRVLLTSSKSLSSRQICFRLSKRLFWKRLCFHLSKNLWSCFSSHLWMNFYRQLFLLLPCFLNLMVSNKNNWQPKVELNFKLSKFFTINSNTMP